MIQINKVNIFIEFIHQNKLKRGKLRQELTYAKSKSVRIAIA